MLIALNKPYQVMSQFSAVKHKRTLAQLVAVPEVYPAGRLDYDSEGLLLLTDDGVLQHRLSAPAGKLMKRYLVQVEGVAGDGQLERLRAGVVLDGRITLPAIARIFEGDAALWPREPGIRLRRNIPTCWIEIGIREGRNRQVRRMTAAVGLPTLRLVRIGIGALDLFTLALAPGTWVAIDCRQIDPELLQKRTLKPIRRATRSASLRR